MKLNLARGIQHCQGGEVKLTLGTGGLRALSAPKASIGGAVVNSKHPGMKAEFGGEKVLIGLLL